MKKYHANTNKKKVGMFILISDKVDFIEKKVTRERRTLHVNQRSISGDLRCGRVGESYTHLLTGPSWNYSVLYTGLTVYKSPSRESQKKYTQWPDSDTI